MPHPPPVFFFFAQSRLPTVEIVNEVLFIVVFAEFLAKYPRIVNMVLPQRTQGVTWSLWQRSLFFLTWQAFERAKTMDGRGSAAKYAILYFLLLFVSVSGFAMVPGIIAERQIVHCQSAAHFFHPLSYSVASRADRAN